MAEHLPEHMIGEIVPAWCGVCQAETKHRVDRVAVGSHAGKLGPCLEHGAKGNERGESKKQERDRERRELAGQQPSLYEFEERAAIKEFCGNMPREEAERQASEEKKR